MTKHYYKIYGLNIVSDYKLKNVIEINKMEDTDVEIKEEELPASLLTESQSERERGYGWIYHMEKKWGFARFINHGAFLVKEGKTISYQLKSSYDTFYVSEIFICLCMNMILMQRGIIAFHGSCILRDGKGIIVSGESGAGKSTTTTELIESGSDFLSDDIVAVSVEPEIMAYPSYPQRKLCKDVIERKRIDSSRISVFKEDMRQPKFAINQLDHFRSEPIAVDSMFILKVDECDDVTVEEILGSDKLKYVIDSIFGKEYYDRMGFGMNEMQKAIKITNAIKIFVITRPKDKNTSAEIVDIIDRALHNSTDMVGIK